MSELSKYHKQYISMLFVISSFLVFCGIYNYLHASSAHNINIMQTELNIADHYHKISWQNFSCSLAIIIARNLCAYSWRSGQAEYVWVVGYTDCKHTCWSLGFIIIIFSGLHHYECVAPLVTNSLQSGRFSARSTASVHDSPWESKSFCTVFIQVIRGRPGGLFQYTEGEEVKICFASILSSIRAICPNRVRRRAWIISVSRGCKQRLPTRLIKRPNAE